MDRFEFYKELYHKENDRKTEITNSFSIPIAIITALATAFFYLLINYEFDVFPFVDGCFVFLLIITAVLIVFSCFYLIRAFNSINRGFEYKGLPYAEELENWHSDLLTYYENNEVKANEDFQNGVIGHLIESIQHNTYTNDIKHSFIYKSKSFMSIGIVFISLTSIPFFINFYTKPSKVTTTELRFCNSNLKQIDNFCVKFDTLIKSINNLNSKVMSGKEKSKVPPPPPPKVRKYNEGGEIPKPNSPRPIKPSKH